MSLLFLNNYEPGVSFSVQHISECIAYPVCAAGAERNRQNVLHSLLADKESKYEILQHQNQIHLLKPDKILLFFPFGIKNNSDVTFEHSTMPLKLLRNVKLTASGKPSLHNLLSRHSSLTYVWIQPLKL